MKTNKIETPVYKAIWVKPEVHQRIKVAALAQKKTMNDYLEDNENIQLKKNKK